MPAPATPASLGPPPTSSKGKINVLRHPSRSQLAWPVGGDLRSTHKRTASDHTVSMDQCTITNDTHTKVYLAVNSSTHLPLPPYALGLASTWQRGEAEGSAAIVAMYCMSSTLCPPPPTFSQNISWGPYVLCSQRLVKSM